MTDLLFDSAFCDSTNEPYDDNLVTMSLARNKRLFTEQEDVFDADDNYLDNMPTDNTPTDNNAMNNELEVMKHYAVAFDQLIQLTGFMNLDKNFYEQLCSIYPLVANEVNDGGHLTMEEKNLANVFKCDALHKECYFSTNDESTFRDHLKNEHSDWQIFSCFYCISKSENHDYCLKKGNTFNDVNEMIDHVVNQHMSQLKYQCNLCFYRAFSFNHVLIHQALEHSKQFFETIKRLVLDKNDEYSNTLEHSFRMYFNENNSDDETEITENEFDESSNRCKIIECWSVKDDHFDMMNYLKRNACNTRCKDSTEFEQYPLHCVYCNDANFQSNCSFWAHLISFHPEHALIGYFVQTASLGDETSNNIQEFKFLIDQYSLPRSYGEKMMDEAFKFYEKSLPPEKRGLKRKRNKENIDSQTTTASIVEENKNGPDDGSKNKSNKRFRSNNWFNGRQILTRTRTVFGLATTVFFALGFYHLNQYLPKSLYEFLNDQN